MNDTDTTNLKLITNNLNLRPPQAASLEILAQLTQILGKLENPSLEDKLAAVQKVYPRLKSFERKFPSVCFALATGIGKTRLMGACIAWLAYENKSKNFFVMAPNLTIYEKLKADFGDVNNPKYVFRGLDEFTAPPLIIDGENYNEFREGGGMNNGVTINIFNIAKLNSDSKSEGGAPARIKRLNEVLGQSYFDYLKNLPDLCIFMDESHHYHADKSFDVINELQPILGVELTATPQIQKGAKKIPFRNIIYEYTLSHALKDEQYVKVPAVITREDFDPKQYTPEQLDREKLIDGVKCHEETKSALEIYSRRTGKRLVKPFMLVVAKDTVHSRKLLADIQSDKFFGGRYANKVIEVNSSLKGKEKDDNIRQLLALEAPDNEIEIVIHVNMLKEGWDVTNLYTIVPLRASASETLTEQTIGRGLRLPYGERTKDAKVDRLSIVSHDRYAAIVELAKNENSVIQKVYDINEVAPDSEPKETVEIQSIYDEATKSESFAEELNKIIAQGKDATFAQGAAVEISKFVAETASNEVVNLNRRVESLGDVKSAESKEIAKAAVIDKAVQKFFSMKLQPSDIETAVDKAVDFCAQALTENVIPIPRLVIQPIKRCRGGIKPFELDMKGIEWLPSSEILQGTELKEGGATFEFASKLAVVETEPVENIIVRRIAEKDPVDYAECGDLLFELIEKAKAHFRGYLKDAAEVEKVLRDWQSILADRIYAQIREHFYVEEVEVTPQKILPFSKIESGFAGKVKSDRFYNLNDTVEAADVSRKIFTGFKKSCHKLCKFDSSAEWKFVKILERDGKVLRWMRPAENQFSIFYDGNSRYEPDFVVETAADIFIVETKMETAIHNPDVVNKSKAAEKYCSIVTREGVKPWKYKLLADSAIQLNFDFEHLMRC